MSGGGDTPKNTHWAYEFESGKFVLGVINDNVLNIECETDSSNLWVVDADGVYIEKIALHSYLESEIVDAINAKYGTDFTELTVMQVSDVTIGEDCPEWDAYEKFEIQWKKIAIQLASNSWIIGDFSNGIYRSWSNPGQNASILVHEDGVVFENQGVPAAAGVSYFNQYLTKIGLEATSVEDYYITMPIGTNVPQWNEYEKIPL